MQRVQACHALALVALREKTPEGRIRGCEPSPFSCSATPSPNGATPHLALRATSPRQVEKGFLAARMDRWQLLNSVSLPELLRPIVRQITNRCTRAFSERYRWHRFFAFSRFSFARFWGAYVLYHFRPNRYRKVLFDLI